MNKLEGIDLLLQTTLKKEIENCFNILGVEIREYILKESRQGLNIEELVLGIKRRYPCFYLEDLVNEKLYYEHEYKLEIFFHEILKEYVLKIIGGSV